MTLNSDIGAVLRSHNVMTYIIGKPNRYLLDNPDLIVVVGGNVSSRAAEILKYSDLPLQRVRPVEPCGYIHIWQQPAD